MDSGGLVTIYRFFIPSTADFFMTMLRANGIGAVLGNDNATAWMPHFTVLTGGVELKVRAEDADRAIALIEEHRENVEEDFESFSEDSEDGESEMGEEDLPEQEAETGVCPNCGSAHTGTVQYAFPLRLLMGIVLLGLPLLAGALGYRPRPRQVCFDCDWEWTE